MKIGDEQLLGLSSPWKVEGVMLNTDMDIVISLT